MNPLRALSLFAAILIFIIQGHNPKPVNLTSSLHWVQVDATGQLHLDGDSILLDALEKTLIDNATQNDLHVILEVATQTTMPVYNEVMKALRNIPEAKIAWSSSEDPDWPKDGFFFHQLVK